MKKKLKIIVCIVAIMIIAFLYAFVDKNYYLYDRSQDSGEYIATGILKNEGISQEFVAQDNKIDGIKAMSTIYGSTENVKIIYSLVHESTKTVVTEGEIEGKNFKNGKFYEFEFRESEIKKGEKYNFILKETGADEVNGIGFSVGNTASENLYNLTINGNNIAGALVARPICHKFDIETFIMFLVLMAYITAFMKLLYKLFK